MNDVHGEIPAEKVREALLRSPSGYLSNEEIRSAYLDLRKSLDLLLNPPNPAFYEGFTTACGEILLDLTRLRADAITAERKDGLDRAIEAVEKRRSGK